MFSLNQLFDRMEMDVEERVDPSSESDPKPIVEFTATDLAVFETEGKIRIGIRRYGRLSVPATVRYCSTETSTSIHITSTVVQRLAQVFTSLVQ